MAEAAGRPAIRDKLATSADGFPRQQAEDFGPRATKAPDASCCSHVLVALKASIRNLPKFRIQADCVRLAFTTLT